MKKINLKKKGFKEISLLIITLISMCLLMGLPSFAQMQNEKPKATQLTPQEQFREMQQWQKENFDCMVDFGNNILNSIAPNGILFISGDASIFTLQYLLKQKGLRPDITVYDWDGIFFKPVMDPKLATSSEVWSKAEREIIRSAKYPVYYMMKRDMQDIPEDTIKPCGMVYQILRPGDKPPDYKNILSKMINLNDYLWKSPTHATREMVANYLYSLGLNYLEMGNRGTGTEFQRRAAQIGFDVKNMNTNLGNTYVAGDSKEYVDEAIYYYLVEIQSQPRNQLAYYWLAYAYEKNGEKDKAVAISRKAIKIDPNNPKAHFSYAGLLGKLGQEKEAIQEYQKGLAIDSTNGDAYYYLGLILEKNHNNPDAVTNYEKSIQYLTDTTHKADARNRLQKLKLK